MFDEIYFPSKFMENFKSLIFDSVPNVRITAMTVVDKYFMKFGKFLTIYLNH